MSSEKEIIEGQVVNAEGILKVLRDIMPDCFFRTFGDGVSAVLPLLTNLEAGCGIRQARVGNDVIFAYLLGNGCCPAVTARKMAGSHLASAVIYQSAKPFAVCGGEGTLVVERYTLADAACCQIPVSLADLQKEYAKCGVNEDAAVAEAYGRLNPAAVRDLDAAGLACNMSLVLAAQGTDIVQASAKNCECGNVEVTAAVSIPAGMQDFAAQLFEVLHAAGLQLKGFTFREMTRNDDAGDFAHLPVLAVTALAGAASALTAEQLEALVADIKLIGWVNMEDLLHKEFVNRHGYPIAMVNWLRSAVEFIHGQLSFIDRFAYQYDYIIRYVAVYPELSKSIFNLFDMIFNPAKACKDEGKINAARAAINAEIAAINTGNNDKNVKIRTIFSCIMNFLDCIRKTNFYSADKSALSFRLAPDFTLFYREVGPSYIKSFPTDIPYGVFFMHRRKAFGYQVRFADIARGGWRTVIPAKGTNPLEANDVYDYARGEAYREVFVLANTQHLKNKDIYEGGSKMFTLMEPIAEPALLKQTLWQNQRSFTRAFLSLINYDENKVLKDKNIVDLLNSREIIEIGPDENMFDTMIEWMGDYAEKAGYTLSSGIISGKPGAGINHKHYGVTSFGVLQYFLKTLDELGIDPTKDAFTLKIAGGPGGDVAGNAMKLLLADGCDGKPLYPNMKIVAITDGPAAAYDPEGLDREEIKRLLLTSNLDSFNPEKLHGEGATIVFSKPIVKDGETFHRQVLVKKNGSASEITEKTITRDEFMVIFQNNMVHETDVFIPAGGRPSTINESNWQDFFPGGKPAFRAIVEGANSYITPAARDEIQSKGVWIVKDASANKCGVITSSYEILSGLLLDSDEFRNNKDELVKEVMEILKLRAVQEANWLYASFRATGTPMTQLTEKLSRDINAANVEINSFLQEHPEYITEELLLAHLPALYRTKFCGRLGRLPEEYSRAVASVELACRVIYAGKTEGNLEDRIKAVL